MLDYLSLRALAAIIQTGSFEKAANSLNVTPSAVSQRVKLLEERLGTVLIVRGNPCIATETGEWLCRHMEQVGMLEQALFKQLPELADPDTPPQNVTVHIATNADSLATWFLPAVTAFTKQTGYLLNMVVDDQQHTGSWLQRGRVMAAVTGLGKPVQGCRVYPLGALRFQAVANSDFFQRYFADGVTAETIVHAPMLTFNQKDDLQSQWVQQTLGQSAGCPTHWLPSTQGFVDAVLLGLGWALNPAMLISSHLAAGRLIELMPGSTLDVPLFWQVSRLAEASLAGLTREIIATARRELVQDYAALSLRV